MTVMMVTIIMKLVTKSNNLSTGKTDRTGKRDDQGVAGLPQREKGGKTGLLWVFGGREEGGHSWPALITPKIVHAVTGAH